MAPAILTESEGPPDPMDCRGTDDEGALHHDVLADIWYECRFDSQNDTHVWMISPPGE
jgi:hypothetical protein